jgi:hypothetical protein
MPEPTMAVLALNLMHDISSGGRRVRRAPIARWMSVALSQDRGQIHSGSRRRSDSDVLGHGLPKIRPGRADHEDARPD